MTKGCLAGTPSFLRQWLAPSCLLFGCLCSLDALLPHALGKWQPAECPQPCCALRLQVGAPSQSGDHFEMSSLK